MVESDFPHCHATRAAGMLTRTMDIARLEGSSKRYGNVRAVDTVNLAIAAGEIYGLLGPNGAGKTTAINMLCGLLRPDAGRALVRGIDMARNPMAAKRDIGVIPQELAIYEDLTALENVKFFASLYGLGGRALTSAAEEALEFTGLADRARQAPKSYSGGMKRRLNVACAIAHKPRLLIMDEPTVGIDPQSRSHILQYVKTLNGQGCTVIYTTHYMEEAEQICGRIAIMDHGKIIAEGAKEELEALITDRNLLLVTVAEGWDRLDREGLRTIPGVRDVEVDGNVVKVTSAREVDALDPIIRYFGSRGVRIRNVESRIPDLETVFLALTGRSLRD
jgi:ABC-2 type transport system ATP-binding protein